MIYICSKGKSANREFWGRNYDPMDSSKKVVACIYCDREVRKARAGKHIIPQAIGGRLTITDVCKGRGVCNSCNSGVLSELDNELCRRSFLSIIAAQELDKSLWLTWDVDHSAGNLLLEAKPDFDRHSMTLFPQMIFESSGPQLRGDHEELQRFAFEDFQKVFVRFMLEAFYEFKAGKRRRLNPKKIQANDWIQNRYRYPPRIFARRPIEQFESGMSFEFQYLDTTQKRFALSQLEKWDRTKTFRQLEVRIGSELPAIRCFFDQGKVVRALAKLAVNLLAAYCPNTPVKREHFPQVIRVVVGEVPVSRQLLRTNGFVIASDIQPINVDGAHSFRLLHMDGQWQICFSFFGGRIGAFVQFPGPNHEEWCCADIAMPIELATIKTGRILQPLRPRIEWTDLTRIMPSVEMVNVKSEIHVDVSKKPDG
jgi:hypothetical protein